MSVRIGAAATLPAGAWWVLDVETTDADDLLADGAPVLTVTGPAGPAPAPVVTHVGLGHYRAPVLVDEPGRWVAGATSATAGAGYAAAYVLAATDGTGMPTAADVVAYMGPTSYTLDQVADALAAESAAQRSRCAVGALYPDDLRNALLRRAQRNLAMRRLPLALLQGDGEAGSDSTMPPGEDPEVRRLERPHRRMPVG